MKEVCIHFQRGGGACLFARTARRRFGCFGCFACRVPSFHVFFIPSYNVSLCGTCQHPKHEARWWCFCMPSPPPPGFLLARVRKKRLVYVGRDVA